MKRIDLRIFGQPVRITADDSNVAGVVTSCYSAFLEPANSSGLEPLELSVETVTRDTHWVATTGSNSAACKSLAILVYTIEKLLTIELQHLRRELFFVHAASLSYAGRSLLVAGESGAGKSTLCWALCNLGYTYMSDELAPVNLSTMEVEPYPHAICLKKVADGMPPLPENTLDTGETLHIPVGSIPGRRGDVPLRIDKVLFLDNSDTNNVQGPIRISKAEASARIYANGLNQLAHDQDGLAAASLLAGAGEPYLMSRSGLNDMCEKVAGIFSD